MPGNRKRFNLPPATTPDPFTPSLLYQHDGGLCKPSEIILIGEFQILNLTERCACLFHLFWRLRHPHQNSIIKIKY
jgi:hypothetical protein